MPTLGPSAVLAYFLEASLDAAVLAGDGFAVPVLCRAAGHAQIWVTLPHGQVAGTLFSVALRLASAAWEAVLAWKTLGHTAAQKNTHHVTWQHMIHNSTS